MEPWEVVHLLWITYSNMARSRGTLPDKILDKNEREREQALGKIQGNKVGFNAPSVHSTVDGMAGRDAKAVWKILGKILDGKWWREGSYMVRFL